MLEGRSCADWLRREFDVLASSPSSVDRVAAVGLLVRLWVPTDEKELAAVIAGTGGSTPVNRAREWARSIDPAVLGEIKGTAAKRAEDLYETLDQLQNAVATGEALHPIAMKILSQRDDLGSVSLMVDLARGQVGLGRDRRLRYALGAFDEHASTYFSTFGMTEGDYSADDRLRAVSWQEPDAWWGQLAVV